MRYNNFAGCFKQLIKQHEGCVTGREEATMLRNVIVLGNVPEGHAALFVDDGKTERKTVDAMTRP